MQNKRFLGHNILLGKQECMAASRRFYLHRLSLWQQQGITLVSVGLDVALPRLCLALLELLDSLLRESVFNWPKSNCCHCPFPSSMRKESGEPWLGHEARFPTCFTKDSCGKKTFESTGLLAGCQDRRLCTWSQGVNILRRGVMEEALCVWEESQRPCPLVSML